MRSTFAMPLLFLATPAFAQAEDAQLWLQTNANIAVAKRTKVTLETIARFSDRYDGLFHSEVGVLVSRKVARNVEVSLGYRHVGSHGGNRADDEDRMRQHVVATFGRVFTRLRIDERFHPAGPEIGFRVRPLVRYNHPVGNGVALFLSHESFIMPNSTDWGQRAGYDRMRNIAGVVLPITEGVSGDLGYLNQYRFGRDGAQDQMEHAMSLQLTLSI